MMSGKQLANVVGMARVLYRKMWFMFYSFFLKFKWYKFLV